MATRYFAEMQVRYLKGEYEKALRSWEIDEHLGAIMGLFTESVYYHTSQFPKCIRIFPGESEKADAWENLRKMEM